MVKTLLLLMRLGAEVTHWLLLICCASALGGVIGAFALGAFAFIWGAPALFQAGAP